MSSLKSRCHIPATLALSRQAGSEGRAGTSCFTARAASAGLLLTYPTQRKIQAAPRVRPNPSIERTRPGKPGRASHVKR